MSNEEKNIFTKKSKDFESATDNKVRNNNHRNNALTSFFSGLLDCNWFKTLILSSLTIVVATFLMLSIFLGIFIYSQNEHMIDVVLGILFKIFMPCAMIFIFFIRFGEYNKMK